MRWIPPRDTFGRDLTVAGGALVAGLVLFGLETYPLVDAAPEEPVWRYLLPMAFTAAGLALRRRAPLVCLGAGTVALIGDAVLGGSLATVLIFTQVLYEACVHGPASTWRWLLVVSLTLTGTATVVGILVGAGWRAAGMIGVVAALLLVFPVVAGLSVRQYRDQAAAERKRAEQTARLGELDRCQAITSERQRMARELHDVIANHLSAVAIHATAAQAAYGSDEATVREALAVIRDSAVSGLAEMRRMIRLLRDPERPADAVSLTRLEEVDRLVDAVRQAGLPVRMSVLNQPRPLPVEVDLAAYRIVQESLTNALKYSGGQPTCVEIEYRVGEVAVTVENPMPAGSGALPVPSGGAGVEGMRERAALLHGSLTVGPENGRWRVAAVLPTDDALLDALAAEARP